MKDEGNFVSVAGKISTWSYGRIMRILKRKGLNIYQMIQNFCDTIIRYMDDKHNRTPDVEKAMNMFEGMIGWENNFNLCDPNTKPEISEATYYLSDFTKDKAKKGVRVVHVERPLMDKWSQTFNVQQILERFMCLTFPSLYRRLRFIAVCRECTSLLELLIDIVGELEREEDKKEMMRDFEDADRGDFGQKPHEGQPYKRPYEASQDTLFKDELI
ncbi:MAG: hypothetical protein J6T37_01625 [Bacteroidales bacterium]|nr:hypothetical protein [Bacteroidaceae bacterium]MBO7528294.1 hypothetical protein [Bacteroidales bacterium]MBO7528555.1 hypothetical protein [Bacteroidales bacterium]